MNTPKAGETVVIVYDARPVVSAVKIMNATVVKVTLSGMIRIKTVALNSRNEPLYNELFYPAENGMAKGWNTLYWRYPRKGELKKMARETLRRAGVNL